MNGKNPTVVFVSPGEIALEYGDFPEPKDGDVLIKTKKSLISIGTELTLFSGEYPRGSAWARRDLYPFTPGYCNVGEIIEIGKGVDTKLIGRRVASRSKHALYVTKTQNELKLVRDGVSDEEATFFALMEIVMNSVRRANIRLGESVVIYGAGLLGQLAARLCRLCGAMPVVVIDIAEKRLEMLPSDKQLILVNPNQIDAVAAVSTATNGRMADVVFEVTGNQNIIPSEFAFLHKQGRFVVLSSPRGPTSLDLHDFCNSPSFTIIGTHYNSHPPVETWDNPWTAQRNCELFFDMLLSKQIDVKSLITHREPWQNAPDIYRMLLKDRSQAMGIVFSWS